MRSVDLSAEEALAAFETDQLDPAAFPHHEHVRLAYEMLARHPLGETVMRFSGGLRALAARAGRPQIYHETITVAFLAVINERRARDHAKTWSEFKETNRDLLDKRCLEHWYAPAQLGSDLARRVFCLPQPRENCPS
jgi:hypothetical protein